MAGAYSRVLGALGPADIVRAMRRTLLSLAAALALGLTARRLRRLRRRRQRLLAGRLASSTVGAEDSLKFDADSYEAERRVRRGHLHERRQHAPTTC